MPERDRHRRELAGVVDHERPDFHDRVDQRGQRYLLPARRFDVDAVERFWSVLELRVHFQNDVVLLQRGVHGRDDALAKGVVMSSSGPELS